MKNANESKKVSGKDRGSFSRREFVGAAAAVAAFTFVPRHVLGGAGRDSANNKLNIAGIGVGGQGGGDMNALAGENVVALCDVDEERAAGTFKRFPNAKRYRDFRVMLEKEQKNIDAVMIATPDHVHAPAAIMAMKMGKHVYCEKPMAHTIYEARRMTDVAREMGVVTQMGQGGHAGEGLRLTYEFIHDGAIGPVREVHVWSDRPIWPQGIERPTDRPPVPKTLDWDLWLGPARWRPYHKAYVPFAWRGWWDFGCGAMGDMAVHNADPAFFCLDLKAPVAVEAETSDVNDETLPKWSIITYEFPARGSMPPVTMKWYDGGKMPPRPAELEEGRKIDGNGIMFVGDKGKILCGGWSGAPRLIPESRMQDYKRPDKTLPRSIGHHAEWIKACKENKPKDAMAGFWYSGPFTEALLVGNLAVRLRKRVEWDAKTMRSPNCPEADNYITKFYRAGFHLV
ncbi:MAG: Gfo/Idh/MocA family oxidoreductase [Sedimentisphaerales bacterium]|nr:Gfo/Idh/MocA family oxidoreductase [Sedimentisphaerales bacterium]